MDFEIATKPESNTNHLQQNGMASNLILQLPNIVNQKWVTALTKFIYLPMSR